MSIRATACALLAAVLAGIAAAPPALSQPAPKEPAITLAPVRVSEHGWFFQGEAGMASAANRGFMSNAGFVVTREGVVVFDALGTPALGEAMVAAIRKVTPQPIRRVVVSHYHADHVYGLQPLKRAGAEIWAHRKGEQYFTSGQAGERLAQRRRDLFPWVDASTAVLRPDLWIDGDTDFRLGGLTFRIIHAEGAHSPEDVMLFVVEDRLLFAGDLLFAGRVPFVGNADSKGWLRAMDKMIAAKPAVVVPGHGPVSRDVERDLVLTRDYLALLREAMGKAVAELESFDEAYARVDWGRFRDLPAFEQANRINAYGTYLLMEQEALSGGRK
ncbi:MAG: MBL fold metallo-hydrolase [Betaproteobacteria bacterium]|nr:MAG: MBL fold metallo-hydrolase [Betaproteobacteria bacterium]